ncbi:hypothetical protein GGQ74_001494 [Desulfobaculum xiamenense]|uniref:Uncharacterized protein n=1 Tax=Desulfobaculum xiamenense TaxID=995050 RepID=A0A846QRN9_9BACT|nr:hypothetical protein [Desulfobaculum xiamenense]NJB67854.1 hypothetical protein [Desulfobaculum xiamenense]
MRTPRIVTLALLIATILPAVPAAGGDSDHVDWKAVARERKASPDIDWDKLLSRERTATDRVDWKSLMKSPGPGANTPTAKTTGQIPIAATPKAPAIAPPAAVAPVPGPTAPKAPTPPADMDKRYRIRSDGGKHTTPQATPPVAATPAPEMSQQHRSVTTPATDAGMLTDTPSAPQPNTLQPVAPQTVAPSTVKPQAVAPSAGQPCTPAAQTHAPTPKAAPAPSLSTAPTPTATPEPAPPAGEQVPRSVTPTPTPSSAHPAAIADAQAEAPAPAPMATVTATATPAPTAADSDTTAAAEEHASVEPPLEVVTLAPSKSPVQPPAQAAAPETDFHPYSPACSPSDTRIAPPAPPVALVAAVSPTRTPKTARPAPQPIRLFDDAAIDRLVLLALHDKDDQMAQDGTPARSMILTKWTGDARVRILGARDDRERAMVADAVERINAVLKETVSISLRVTEFEPNISVFLLDGGDGLDGYTRNTYAPDQSIESANVVLYRDAATPRTILRETLRALGVTGCVPGAGDSVFSTACTSVQKRSCELPDADANALRLMYHPSLKPGMDAAQLRAAAARLVAER